LCSAVTVTVFIDGDAVEGQETRLVCTIQKSDSTNTNDPLIRWVEVVKGSPVTIVEYQAGSGPVYADYADRFSVESDGSQLTLVIDNTMRTDDGTCTYQCDVSVLNDPPSPASGAVTISVAYKPEFGLATEDTVSQNEQYIIEFEVAANPSNVTYQWTTDPSGIEDTDTNPATFTVNNECYQ
ncbi:uncharacterized protein LOC117110379, partial [Anneissia japonica]|uniref:uncharacterized protein LOC117110379 n=1 Tax=Anneissia japonica TaxID=1529436 RepID=UPI0014256659